MLAKIKTFNKTPSMPRMKSTQKEPKIEPKEQKEPKIEPKIEPKEPKKGKKGKRKPNKADIDTLYKELASKTGASKKVQIDIDAFVAKSD